MLKIMTIFISCQIVFMTNAKTHSPKKTQNYLKARKQYLLEYTTFGVDECLKLHADKIIAREDGSGKIVAGSLRYFGLLSVCFSKMTKKCYGENCIVSRSMSKRLDNIKHVDSILKGL